MMSDALRAVILGIVEGVTEFLPVSATGHLLLAERFFDLGEGNFWKSFAVLIQLGAILAIVAIYFFKLWRSSPRTSFNLAHQRIPVCLIGAFFSCLAVRRCPPARTTSLPFQPT